MIRRLLVHELDTFMDFMRLLAEHEGLPDSAVAATEQQIHIAVFGPHPQLFVNVIDVDGEIIGVASWCERFAPWTGKSAMWICDLFVLPQFRNSFHSVALLRSLAKECVTSNMCRIEWKVFPGNADAQSLYRSIGAEQSELRLWELPLDKIELLVNYG